MLSSKRGLDFYNQNAVSLVEQYERIDFEDVHPLLSLILCHSHKKNRILDVGAGSGRDSAYMAEIGCEVVAVEPSRELIRLAVKRHDEANVVWIRDSAPELKSLSMYRDYFDILVFSAVLMDLSPNQIEALPARCGELLRKNGDVYVTLKNTLGGQGVSPVFEEIADIFARGGFSLIAHLMSKDFLDRKDVLWEALLFRQNFDGEG